MSRGFTFHSAAQAELREGVVFYETDARRLGADIAAKVRAIIEQILEYPDAGSPADAGVRRRLLRRFPYTIVYLCDVDPISIVAVMHQRRKPGYWLTRVRNP